MKLQALMFATAALASTVLGGALAGEPPQDSTTTQPLASLSIQSIPDSAHVMLDGHGIGTTPLTCDSITPGTHILLLQHPDVESWLTDPTVDTVKLEPGENKTLRYTLRSRYLITSSPFAADVVVGDSSIGTTPLVTSMELNQRSIMLRRPGYEPSTFRISDDHNVSISLKKLWDKEGVDETYFKELNGRGEKPISLYIAGAATVVSGVAAAYFKVKADGRYQQYLNTGDRALLSQTNDLDTAAGIAIAATQVGLGLFTYFLFSQ